MIGDKIRTTAKHGLNRRHAPDLSAKPLLGALPMGTELLVLDDSDAEFYLATRNLNARHKWLGDLYLIINAEFDDVFFVWKDLTEPVEIMPRGKAAWGNWATHWPTDYKIITQFFGANPQNYERFGLPGHEGIDIRCPIGSPYYAIAPGDVVKVSDKRSNGTESAYGWHVIIDHNNGFTSLYAHAEAGTIPVKVGQRVNGGSIVAFSGNTGNSSGAHLHLTIKLRGAQVTGYPPGYIDPLPELQHHIIGGA